jgi:hypothetical protein
VSEGAATPHCALFDFFLLPKISLLATGAVRGFGMVMPVVSVSAETSMAEGGAMFELVSQVSYSNASSMML